MEFTFSELKQKEVINLNDGKHLGKVCDVSFAYPENNLLGLFVTGGKGFKFSRQDQFIPMKAVQKIGEDAILVKLNNSEKPDCPPKPKPDCRPCPPPCNNGRRSLDEYE